MRVFLDTNVLLDVLADRKPFYAEASQIWSLAERAKIEAQVSVISFNNIYYVVRRAANRRAADRALKLMRNVFTAVALNAKVLSQAIDAGFSDFEDAIQFHSAVYAGAECMITRDADHFPSTAFPVLSPAQFLVAYDMD